MRFGDVVCYALDLGLGLPHDPVMVVGPCGHPEGRDWKGETTGLIDILDLASPDGVIDHKDPSVWQPCTHVVEWWPA